jgi:hypothetical protein
MQAFHANTVADLERVLGEFGDECLFRGQTNAYWDVDGAPLLNSSFVRKGCIPPLMLKWSFFVRELLRRGGFDVTKPDALSFNQGLLQHYGWRSFFVDLSSSKAVAAWFASHAFESERGWDFCENSFEEPVMLGVQRARYSRAQGTGHLYVLSKESLKKGGHTLVDLDGELTTDCPTRYHAQRAWLAGIFLKQRRLEPLAIVAHVAAPSEILREHAAASGYKSTVDLFPGPDKDKMLDHLLSLPYLKLHTPSAPFPFFVRSLDIPEYHDSFVKHLPTTTVLAAPLWVSDEVTEANNSLWLRVREDTFYCVTDANVDLPRLAPYFRHNAITHIETDGLVCFPVVKGSSTYDKGIVVRRDDAGLYEVANLTVDYRSDRLTATGASRGYRYSLNGDRLVRTPSEGDCPCGDPERHRYHLQTLAVLDDMLRTAKTHRRKHIVTVEP